MNATLPCPWGGGAGGPVTRDMNVALNVGTPLVLGVTHGHMAR